MKIENHLPQGKLYEIGGGWGNSVAWTHPEQFNKGFSDSSTFDVHGWKFKRPRVGDVVDGEFSKSFIRFQFVEVRLCGDPKDMFFGKVVPIGQKMKQ